jgi:hypothetical protein
MAKAYTGSLPSSPGCTAKRGPGHVERAATVKELVSGSTSELYYFIAQACLGGAFDAANARYEALVGKDLPDLTKVRSHAGLGILSAHARRGKSSKSTTNDELRGAAERMLAHQILLAVEGGTWVK